MTSSTYAVVFAVVFASSVIGNAQQATEPPYLETTLFPAVELTIRSGPRSRASSVHDVYSKSKATSLLHGTVYRQHSPVTITTVSSSILKSTTVPEYHRVSTLDGALTPDLSFRTTAVRQPAPIPSWDSSYILPSFTSEIAPPQSFTKFIHSSDFEHAASSVPDASDSSAMFTPDSVLGTSSDDVLLTQYPDRGTLDISSHMAVEKSSSHVQLDGASGNPETTGQVLNSESEAGISTAENITPTSRYVSETESLSHGHNMIYGSQVDTTPTVSETPDATSVDYGDAFQTKVVEAQEQSHPDVSVYPKRLSFVLKKRCSDNDSLLETFGKLNEQLVEVLNSTVLLSENQSAFLCERTLHLTMPVKNMTDSVLKETVTNLTKNMTFREGFRLEKIYLYENDRTKTVLFSVDALDDSVSNFDGYTLSERELIAYIVAGVSIGTLIFILLMWLCVRFVCKKETTSLDLCDIPHLNLKLEDYKLTPIPRPTISFSEYGRELFNPSYSEHTPKLEDTILNQHHFTADTSAPGARESMSFPREMRTFGGKKGCSRVQSLDGRPNIRSGNGWISNSREKLSKDFERRNSGFDNVAFRKWF